MSRIKSLFSLVNDQIIYVVLLAFLFIIPLIVIPHPYIQNSFIKIGILALVVTITVALLFFKVLKYASIEVQSRLFLLALCAIPLAVLLSTFFGLDTSNGFFSLGSSMLTFYFVTIGAFLVYVVATTFKSKNRMFFAYMTLLASAGIIFLFHIIRMFAGFDVLSLGIFTSGASNTIGSWNDLGIFVASIVLLSCATLEYLPLSNVWKTVLWIVLVLGIILLAGTNFYVILFQTGGILLSVFVGLCALAICAHTFARVRDLPDGTCKRVFPVASFIVVIVCSVFTMAAPEISQFVYTKASITQQEVVDVRMTQGTTFTLLADTYKGGIAQTIFGIGSARFETAWTLYKPQSVNLTTFWDTEATYASGYLSTFFITAGLLGLLAVLYVFVYTAAIAYRYFKIKSQDHYDFYFGLTSFGIASLIWISAMFYIPSVTVIVLGCFMLGLFYASAIREGVISSSTKTLPTMGGRGMGIAAVSTALIILIVASFYTWSERLSASMYANKAVGVYSSTKDINSSKTLLVKAISKYPSDVYLRIVANLDIEQVAESLRGKSQLTEGNLTDEMKANLNQARGLGEQAVIFNPYSYQNHLALGNTYEIIAQVLGVDYAIAARDQYLASKQLNPQSPIPNGNLARIYYKAGEYSGAEAEILDAMQKKPDMTQLNADLAEIRNTIKKKGTTTKTPALTATSSTTKSIKK